MLLAGDIGGTKTVLGVYAEEKGCDAPLHSKTFASNHYGSLEEIITEFLTTVHSPVERAVLGVAGPVRRKKAAITNLPWTLEEQHLQQASGIPSVKLLNDLEAVAWSIPILNEQESCPLNDKGTAEPHGTIAILAPGTGLGEAFLVWDGCRYQAHPSEGGHSDFAPTNALEIELLAYLLGKYSHVSYERVCSGIGISSIYDFLKETGREEEPVWLRKRLDAVQDATPVIVNSATGKERPCAICKMTLEIFISLLAAEAGNMALKFLPSGGMYLGGGIPPRILDVLKDGRFLARFLDKGRISKVLTAIPVNIILKPDAALTGAACYGFDSYRHSVFCLR